MQIGVYLSSLGGFEFVRLPVKTLNMLDHLSIIASHFYYIFIIFAFN